MQNSLTTSLLSDANPFLDHYPQPGQLYEVPWTSSYWNTIETMLMDDQISTSLEQRKSRALDKPTLWKGDAKAIAFIQETIERTESDDILDCLAMIEKGFNPIEIDWINESGRWWIASMECRDPSIFRVSTTGQLQYRSKDFQWHNVPAHKVALFTMGATRDKPYGKSALKPCFPHWQAKWKMHAQLERLGDKYSIPPVVALCETSDDDELAKVGASLAALESATGVAVSGVNKIESLTVTGKMEELLTGIKQKDQAMSKSLTGQVLATDVGDSGSYAQSKTHESSLEAIAIKDVKRLLHILNRTIYRSILEVNNLGHLRAEQVFDEQSWKQQQTQHVQQPAIQLSNQPDPTLQLFL